MSFIEAFTSLTTSLVAVLVMASTVGTITARQRFVQASPPYNLGNGDIPLFVFVEVASDGSILGTCVSTDPPWAYNGPTNILADVTRFGKGFKIRPKGFANPVSVAALMANPALREQFLDAKRSVDTKKPNTFDLIEIDKKFKNRNMD